MWPFSKHQTVSHAIPGCHKNFYWNKYDKTVKGKTLRKLLQSLQNFFIPRWLVKNIDIVSLHRKLFVRIWERTANLTFRENIDKRWVAFKTLIDCYNEYSVICSFLKFIQLDTSIFFLVSHIPTQFVYNCSVLFIQFAVLYFIC